MFLIEDVKTKDHDKWEDGFNPLNQVYVFNMYHFLERNFQNVF